MPSLTATLIGTFLSITATSDKGMAQPLDGPCTNSHTHVAGDKRSDDGRPCPIFHSFHNHPPLLRRLHPLPTLLPTLYPPSTHPPLPSHPPSQCRPSQPPRSRRLPSSTPHSPPFKHRSTMQLPMPSILSAKLPP